MGKIDTELYQMADTFQKQTGQRIFRASLGDENGRIDVPGQAGYVYVRYYTATGLSQAFIVAWRAGSMTKAPGTGVIVEFDYDKSLAIKRADYPAMLAQGTNPIVNNPADPNNSYWIQQQRIVTFASHPVSSAADSMLVTVQSGKVTDLSTDTITLFAGDQIDLTSYIPGGAGEFCLACLFWKTDNTIEVVTSTPKTSSNDLGFDDINECVAARSAGSLPLWAWQLYNGQTGIAAGAPANGGDDFMDLRDPFFLLQSSGGSGITQLTGDVTAGPGSGSQAATLANSGVSAGSYTNASVTFDAKGRATAASSGTAPVTSVSGTSPIASSGGATPAISINDTAVTPGSYTNASLTVDQKGRLTAASSGATPAPVGATYITQTADGTLTNEQALSALATGIMKVTTTTGVVSSITDSAGLAGAISDETGSGALVFGTSPTIATPTVSGEKVTDFIDFAEASTPSTPASDHARIWAADDNGFTVEKWIDAGGQIFYNGRDVWIICRNTTGSTISKNALVAVNGQSNGYPSVLLADADNISTNSQSFLADGIAMDTATNNSYFRMMLFGVLENIDTSGFSAGANLYLSTTAGTYSVSQPSRGAGWIQKIGQVLVSNASTGSIQVNIKPPFLSQIYSGIVAVGVGNDAAIRLYGTATYFGAFTFATLTANRTATFIDADGNVVLDTAAQTLTNKTLTTPTIASFTNATHNHQNAAGGNTLDAAAVASGTLSEARLPHKFAVIEEQQTTNTAGGGSTATTWTTRVLNTEVADADGIVSISSNKFTPISGTYRITVNSPYYGNATTGGVGRIRLRNVTAASVVYVGNNHAMAANVGVNMTFTTQFTANGADEYDIQYYVTQNRATDGLGRAVNEATAVERYTNVLLEKIA